MAWLILYALPGSLDFFALQVDGGTTEEISVEEKVIRFAF